MDNLLAKRGLSPSSRTMLVPRKACMKADPNKRGMHTPGVRSVKRKPKLDTQKKQPKKKLLVTGKLDQKPMVCQCLSFSRQSPSTHPSHQTNLASKPSPQASANSGWHLLGVQGEGPKELIVAIFLRQAEPS